MHRVVSGIAAAVMASAAAACPGVEIVAPAGGSVGELVFIQATEIQGRTRWILPDGFAGEILQTPERLALIPREAGPLELLLIDATDTAIEFARVTIAVDGDPKPRATPSATPTPPAAPVASRVLIVYSMPAASGICEPCERWKATELGKLRGWDYAENTTGGAGVTVFPSFSVRANGHEQFAEGYRTADELTEIVKGLEAL